MDALAVHRTASCLGTAEQVQIDEGGGLEGRSCTSTFEHTIPNTKQYLRLCDTDCDLTCLKLSCMLLLTSKQGVAGLVQQVSGEMTGTSGKHGICECQQDT